MQKKEEEYCWLGAYKTAALSSGTIIAEENKNVIPGNHNYYCKRQILECAKRATRCHFNVSLLQNPTLYDQFDIQLTNS